MIKKHFNLIIIGSIWFLFALFIIGEPLGNYFDAKRQYIAPYYISRQKEIMYIQYVKQGMTRDKAMEKAKIKSFLSQDALENYYYNNVKPFIEYYYPDLLLRFIILILFTQILIGLYIYYEKIYKSQKHNDNKE